jgi:ComF family protein
LFLLAPPSCAACELEIDTSSSSPGDAGRPAAFCAGCAPLVESVPTAPTESLDDSAYVYAGPMADAVRAMKYAGRFELATPLGCMLASRVEGRLEGLVDVVMPLPLHPRKLRARGVNPAALLAHEVAARLGVPLCTRRLVRVRDTREQAGLDRAQRGTNVRAAFEARTAQGSAKRVLLIDDVRTTGATLQEAARTLEDAGHSVRTLTLARADADAAFGVTFSTERIAPLD